MKKSCGILWYWGRYQTRGGVENCLGSGCTKSQRVLQKLDADEKSVINDYMHFLIAVKKAGTEVDIVLHKDFRAAFQFLVNPDNRKKLGISPTNPFLFTNKRCNRSLPFYSRFEEVCKEAGLSEKLKAPDVRD